MAKVFVTREIPSSGINLLKDKGYEVVVSPQDGVISREDLLVGVKGADAVLSILTDKIDGEVLDAVGPQLKIVANYAVGYNNLDLSAAKQRNVVLTNTPGVLTNTVAEHTFSLMMAIAHRVCEGDRLTRAGKFIGWGPMMLLGNDICGKTLGILGLGRIGAKVAEMGVNGFEMKVLYYDVKRNEEFEKQTGAEYREINDLLKESDFVSIHVPLLPETQHLLNMDRLAMMKKTAYLINTSRGPVVDEKALVEALKDGVIRGAALDVFEEEPKLAPGLAELENVIITPHIASATEETRGAMSELAAKNIIAVLEGQEPLTQVK